MRGEGAVEPAREEGRRGGRERGRERERLRERERERERESRSSKTFVFLLPASSPSFDLPPPLPPLLSPISCCRLFSFRPTSSASQSQSAAAAAAAAEEESLYSLVPRGGAVDSVTSYVANYVRSYMQRCVFKREGLGRALERGREQMPGTGIRPFSWGTT